MKVTREVIIDLLPAYFSNEASADTRALVEEFFRQDPEFAEMAKEHKTEELLGKLMAGLYLARGPKRAFQFAVLALVIAFILIAILQSTGIVPIRRMK
jgi:hypothetical protein